MLKKFQRKIDELDKTYWLLIKVSKDYFKVNMCDEGLLIADEAHRLLKRKRFYEHIVKLLPF